MVKNTSHFVIGLFGNQIIHCKIGSIIFTCERRSANTLSQDLGLKYWRQWTCMKEERQESEANCHPLTARSTGMLARAMGRATLLTSSYSSAAGLSTSYCCPILLPLPMYMYCHILCTCREPSLELEPPIYPYHSLLNSLLHVMLTHTLLSIDIIPFNIVMSFQAPIIL